MNENRREDGIKTGRGDWISWGTDGKLGFVRNLRVICMYGGLLYCTCKGGLLQLCYALCGNVELLCLAQWLAAGFFGMTAH